LFESVWSQIAKDMKEIRKTENEKELEQKKREGQPLGRPGNRTSPAATEPAHPRPSPPLPFLYLFFILFLR
jgi:hypothetical protein